MLNLIPKEIKLNKINANINGIIICKKILEIVFNTLPRTGTNNSAINKEDVKTQINVIKFASKPKKTILKQKDTDTKAIEKELSAALGLRVFIEHSAGGENGSIILKYKTLEEFDRVRDLLIGED